MLLLDDNENLKGLENLSGGVLDPSFWRYVFSGHSGPTGRPVSLFTFAMQYSAWPYGAHLFKLVNVCIHGINSILLFLIVYKVGQIQGRDKNEILIFSACVALIWALHPINITSVLYVVQRMTSLAALFGFLSILVYVNMVYRKTQNHQEPPYLMLATFILFLGLSVLSKENGILFCGYLLCIEYLAIGKYKHQGRLLYLRYAFCYFPLLLFAGYLIFIFGRIVSAYEIRDFTMSERIMTEGRVLWTYVSAILLPSLGKYGLYFDDFIISRTLTDPISTILSIISWSLLVVLLFIRRMPSLIKFCILWFFVGHTIESTFIGLEIYFEHRNYVPSIGLIVLFVAACFSIYARFSIRIVRVVAVGALCLFILNVVFISYSDISLWSKPLKQAHVWVGEHPNSYRARTALAYRFMLGGEYKEAKKQQKFIIERWPTKGRAYMDLILLSCHTGDAVPDINTMADIYHQSSFAQLEMDKFRELVDLKKNNRCAAVTHDYLQSSLLKVHENKSLDQLKHLPMLMKAKLYFYEGDYEEGKKCFQLAQGLAENEEQLSVMLAHSVLLVNKGFLIDAREVWGDMLKHSEWAQFQHSKARETIGILEKVMEEVKGS